MRVVETDTLVPTYKMGKNRKHKLRKKNEGGASDTSEEGAIGGLGCTHINKAVNLAAVRKAVTKPSVMFGECLFCTKDKSGASKETSSKDKSGASNETSSKDKGGASRETTVVEGATADTGESEVEITIWVCLQCGHQGCDRNSREKHALAHYDTPHSGIHCVVVNLTTWTAWCYACDDPVPLETCKRVQECVDMLRKVAGLPRVDHSATSAAGRRINPEVLTEQPAVKDKGRPTTPRSGGTTVSCHKVMGLSNLGNTCFFNAVMQNLSQTHSLDSMVAERSKKGRPLFLPGHTTHSDSDTAQSSDEDSDDDTFKDMPAIEIVPADCGPLTLSLLSFLQEMNNVSSRNMVVNPGGLFGQVCKKAPRFKGFQQQDSHELLRYLMDVIRTEEIKRGQMGVLKHFKLPECTNPKKVDEDTKVKVKEYGRMVKHTFLDSLFGGQLVSTIMCEECKQVSQIFEPFLDLSLPVTEEKPQRPNLILGGRKKDSMDTEVVRGADSVVDRGAKPSKHSEKKNKKQAKREAKAKRREAKQSQHKPSGDLGRTGSGLEGDQGKFRTEDDDGEDSPGSAREDPSDADIEDNLESDSSRLLTTQTATDNSTDQTDSTLSLSNHVPTLQDWDISCQNSAEGMQAIPSIRVEDNHNCAASMIPPALPNGHLEREVTNGPAHIADHHLTRGVVLGIGAIRSHLYSSGPSLNNGPSNTSVTVGSLCGDLSGLTFADQSESEASSDSFKECIEARNRTNNGSKKLHCNECFNMNSNPNRTDPLLNGCASGVEGQDLINHSGQANGQSSDPLFDADNVDGASVLDVDGQSTTKGYNDVTSRPEQDQIESLSLTSDDMTMNGSLTDQYSTNQLKKKLELKKQAQYKSMNILSPRYHPAAKECSVMSCLHQFTSAELLTGSNKFGCKQCTKNKRKKAISQQKERKSMDTVYTNASKQYHIFLPPAILTLHLKRFEQVGFASRKVNRHVDFPFLLDLAPYCSALCQGIRPGQKKILYSLYGVVEHSGRLSGGHYTAYIKVRPSLAALTSFLHPQLPTPQDYVHHYASSMLNGSRSPPTEEDPSDAVLEGLVPPGKWYHISDSRVVEVQESHVQRAQAYLLFYERIY